MYICHVHDARPTYTHTYTTTSHTHLHANTHACVCMRIHTRVCTHIYIHNVCIHLHACTQLVSTDICTPCKHAHIRSLINIYTCIKHVCLCTHTGMHTTLRVHTNTGMGVYTCTIHTYSHTYTYTLRHIHSKLTCTCLYTFSHTHPHTMHLYTCVPLCVCTNAGTHLDNTCAHMHASAHTHCSLAAPGSCGSCPPDTIGCTCGPGPLRTSGLRSQRPWTVC